MEYTATHLTSALIGLARATEGNANKPSHSTHKAMLTGMKMVIPGAEGSQRHICEIIKLLHKEKEKLVPRCSTCQKSCGRNDDYPIYEINKLEPNLLTSKHALLSALLSLEPLIRRCSDNAVFEQAMDFIYKGFFYVGYDCEVGSISPLLYELEEIRCVLGESYLEEILPNSNDRALVNLKNSNDLIQYFINVIETKDLYTQGHSHHVKVIVSAIYDSLPATYQRKIDKEKLLAAALLHDIGKIMTPDHILNKDGELDEDEWCIMRQHPENGKNIIGNTNLSDMGGWIMYHHERIDGCGYYGLKGNEIPMESRIIAIADTFSALRTYRVYRPAKSISETMRIMRENAGTQLDSEILNYFFAIDRSVLETLECNCEICRQRRKALEAKMYDDAH